MRPRGCCGSPRWSLLFVACNTGGVAATTLFPSTADTLNYGADLRLSLDPSDISKIQSPTVFGDIRLDFGGPVPAPGVVAQVHVKERITDLLARPNISVQSLQPGPLELERAARGGAIALGLAVRRRRPRRRPPLPRRVCRVATAPPAAAVDRRGRRGLGRLVRRPPSA